QHQRTDGKPDQDDPRERTRQQPAQGDDRRNPHYRDNPRRLAVVHGRLLNAEKPAVAVGAVAVQQRADHAAVGLRRAGRSLPGGVAHDEEPLTMALLLCAWCLLIAACLLGLQAARQLRARLLVARRLQGQLARETRLGEWLHWLGSSPLGQRLQKLDGESQAL